MSHSRRAWRTAGFYVSLLRYGSWGFRGSDEAWMDWNGTRLKPSSILFSPVQEYRWYAVLLQRDLKERPDPIEVVVVAEVDNPDNIKYNI